MLLKLKNKIMGQYFLCNCNNNTYNTVQRINETNLSKINQYDINSIKNMNIQLSYKEQRTKAGTLWEKMKGIEKIVTLYYINRIIKAYRNHLKRKRENEIDKSF